MTTKTDGERLAVLETQASELNVKVTGVESSVSNMHGKIDTLIMSLQSNFVLRTDFDDYRKTIKETLEKMQSSSWQRTIVTILVTATITALIAVVIREKGY